MAYKENFNPGLKNVIRQYLVNSKQVFLPFFYIKLGMIKQFEKNLCTKIVNTHDIYFRYFRIYQKAK